MLLQGTRYIHSHSLYVSALMVILEKRCLCFSDAASFRANLSVSKALRSCKVGRLELPWPGIDIFCTSTGLWRWIVKELDLKLTLGMAER